MTDRDEQHYEKRVDYVAKDEDAQTATGVVMVPNTVDHQGDWERPETIRAFAEEFDAFVDAGEADGGVMHAVWPSDWMNLERNEVLEEAEEIGGQEVPAESWIQTWQYTDDELWSLVEDGILDGHSIGADAVDWDYNGEDPEDLPDDVTVPDEVDVDEYFELEDGIVREVSAVDIPAVPDARILATSKARAATAQKRLAEHLGNRDGFVEEAMERGHSEEDAQRLWDVLDRAVGIEGAGEPGANRSLTDAAKAFVNELTRGAIGSNEAGGQDAQTAKDAAGGETSDDGGKDAAGDDMTDNDDTPPEWARELKEQVEENNEQIEAALEGDDDEKNASGEGGDDAEKDAWDEAPEWAKELKEETEKNSQRIDDVAKASGTSQQLEGGAGPRDRGRKYSSKWDDTLGLPNGGDA
jgi:hypothetical protein